MWFRKKKRVQLQRFLEWELGQVVRHKVTGKRAVIVRIEQETPDCIQPVVSIGWAFEEEFGTTFAEIERHVEPASTNAADRPPENLE